MILMEDYDALSCLWFCYAIKCSLFFQICQSLLPNSNRVTAWCVCVCGAGGVSIP